MPPDWGDGGFFRIGYGECGIDDTSSDRDPGGATNQFPMYGVDGISERRVITVVPR
jgi:hypothetical protein